jgi:hypothetical protein
MPRPENDMKEKSYRFFAEAPKILQSCAPRG